MTGGRQKTLQLITDCANLLRACSDPNMDKFKKILIIKKVLIAYYQAGKASR